MILLSLSPRMLRLQVCITNAQLGQTNFDKIFVTQAKTLTGYQTSYTVKIKDKTMVYNLDCLPRAVI